MIAVFHYQLSIHREMGGLASLSHWFWKLLTDTWHKMRYAPALRRVFLSFISSMEMTSEAEENEKSTGTALFPTSQ